MRTKLTAQTTKDEELKFNKNCFLILGLMGPYSKGTYTISEKNDIAGSNKIHLKSDCINGSFIIVIRKLQCLNFH